MKYPAVLFDLDDTLLDTSTIKWAHHKATAKQYYGVEVADDQLKEHWGKPLDKLMLALYGEVDTPENMMKANRSLNDQFPKGIHSDAISTVREVIRLGAVTGIVTALTAPLARTDLRQLGFSLSDFSFIQGADGSDFHKPDPRVFDPALKLLAQKGIGPADIVYVGDALTDFQAATGAGLSFIGVTTGFVNAEQFKAAGAQHAVARLVQILPLIT